MVRLSVNINKVATLRNARGGQVPDLTRVAEDCQRFGAEGITVHPRPDERHVRRSDVRALKSIVTTEFNIEGYPSDDFLELIQEVRPAQATLVPDPPGVLTSNAGWDAATHKEFLSGVVAKIRGWGIRTSLFVEATEKSVTDAAATGTDRVELYTESYAREYPKKPSAAVAPFARAAEAAHRSGIGLNAGHDLSLENLEYFRRNVPHLLEVSIGHALISDALYYGLENTIQMYLRKLRQP